MTSSLQPAETDGWWVQTPGRGTLKGNQSQGAEAEGLQSHPTVSITGRSPALCCRLITKRRKTVELIF